MLSSESLPYGSRALETSVDVAPGPKKKGSGARLGSTFTSVQRAHAGSRPCGTSPSRIAPLRSRRTPGRGFAKSAELDGGQAEWQALRTTATAFPSKEQGTKCGRDSTTLYREWQLLVAAFRHMSACYDTIPHIGSYEMLWLYTVIVPVFCES